MASGTETRQKRQLNSQDFQRFLARLHTDPVRASAEYIRLKDLLVRYCFSRDEHLRAEELADNALDALAKRPDLEEIRDLGQFAIGVLRMMLLAHRRRSAEAAVEEPEMAVVDLTPEHTIVHRLDRERKEQCFINCMNHLTPAERALIFEYYPNENRDLEARRAQLARKLGIEAGTLVTRMNRLRNRLQKCCLSCYRRSAAGRVQTGGPNR